MNTDGFQVRSGCFACGECGRQTRRTRKQGNGDLCPQCDERSMIENGLSDGDGYDTPEQIANAKARIVALRNQAISMGGSL